MVEYKNIKNLEKEMAREYEQVQEEHLRSLKLFQDQLEETRKYLKRVITLLENS